MDSRGFLLVVAILAFLGMAALLTCLEPVLPDAADCAARGKASDCWREAEHGAALP